MDPIADAASIAERVVRLRRAAGLSQSALARRLKVSPQSIQQLEAGQIHRPRYLLALARLFEVSPDWLESGAGPAPGAEAGRELPPVNVAPEIVNVLSTGGLPADVEVWGVAVGGGDGEFSFNGTVIDYVRRPPSLAEARTVFAIYVIGDSMSPRYEHGDLIFVHKGRPPRVGDDVVVELFGEAGAAGPCFVKRLLRRTGSRVLLRQFNPPRDDIEFPAERVKHIYRILNTGELLGV